ncbi:MAG TPA: glycosyltransferase family 1 protein [Candidatus Saccharimonadales bacterium]|nr:glycosyltransferase family 1 protein [Candidatus Saccharimonadales bacterium]
MRILFVTIDAEESMRGIGAIMKNLIRAAREDGHEVGLLTGIPYKHAYEGNKELRDRVEHIHLQHYLLEGRKSFRYMIKGGYRRRTAIKMMLKLKFLEHSLMKVRPELLSGKKTLAHELDFIIRAPFAYQFIARNKARVSRMIVGRIARAYDVDVVYAVSPTILRSKDLGHRTKLVTFVHDIMPLELIEDPADNGTQVRFARQVETALKHSDLVQVNSKNTAEKLKPFKPRCKVDVVYGVVSSVPEDLSDSAILEMKNLQPQNYLLYATGIEKRKNVGGLLEAYAIAYDRIRKPLVIIGAPAFGVEDIVEIYESLPGHIQDNVLFTGFISEEDKFTLYKNALIFTFPSFSEGFSITVLEAMSYGIPVLTSRGGALPETAADAALYVENPYDIHEIAEKMVELANNRALRTRLSELGRERQRQFTFKHFKDKVGDSLKRLEKEGK